MDSTPDAAGAPGPSLVDAGRVRFVAVVALLAVVVQAAVLGTVGTAAEAAVAYVIAAVGIYAGLAASDVLWDRYVDE